MSNTGYMSNSGSMIVMRGSTCAARKSGQDNFQKDLQDICNTYRLAMMHVSNREESKSEC